MKRLLSKFLFVALMCTAVSCMKLDPSGKDVTYSFMGTWHGESLGTMRFYISLGTVMGENYTNIDMSGKIIAPSNLTDFKGNVSDGQRGFVYIMDDGTINWSNNVIPAKIEYAEHVVTKEIYSTEMIDTLGKVGLDIEYIGLSTDKLSYMKYVDVQISFYSRDGINHDVWLAENLADGGAVDVDGYCNLYLRQKPEEDKEIVGGSLVRGVASFLIDPKYCTNVKGMKIYYQSIDKGKEVYAVINLEKN